MYISETRGADAAKGGVAGRGATLRALSGNVLALGMVSLLTDISSEMVTAILPLYLFYQLSLNPAQFGLLDGLYTGATAVLRLVGGHVADRFRSRKLVAGAGYGLSAVVKLGYLMAGRSVPLLGFMIGLDRTGKGLRTAPRDAMISLSAPPEAQGRAFGVHRAMDTAGALMGPLAAFGVVALVGAAYDAVFVVSFCVAVLGVLVLVLFVREPGGTARERPKVSLRDSVGLLRDRPYRRVLIAMLPLAVATVSDSFLYLVLQRSVGLDAGWLPLLPVAVSAAYLAAAVPFGRLADRLGRSTVVIGGYAALLACYALLLVPASPVILVVVLALRGLSYAATDGVVSALAGPLLPEERRATGLAVVQTGQALGLMVASWAFGVLWSAQGSRAAVMVMTGALCLALAVAVPLLRKAQA
ncbi:MFS transporter [Sphaerisporangium krabiense]|uniref:MFS family permease n=1 Tax=Sphaerisporangium krabiense TaxID=763782 RepID=A0A7W8Z0Z0_9ACTN|nr:MFS transporter [Sphaerisporangium krabiense]MBB5625406.1 MFS family permease [Sphaerisporangium krabiense]GII64080.1 MFS transporter [Sphaerisporangium krabiense]